MVFNQDPTVDLFQSDSAAPKKITRTQLKKEFIDYVAERLSRDQEASSMPSPEAIGELGLLGQELELPLEDDPNDF